jgi:hypothetical protein
VYTEISHAEIMRCTLHIRDFCLAQTTHVKCKSLCADRFGRARRCSVVIDRFKGSTILIELQHAFFNVGKSHVLQQTDCVSMGSNGGPVA